MSSSRIAILTSGGDAPGMNAAVRAATLVALSKGAEVLGVRHGYRGLLAGRLEPLAPADVGGIVRQGGTTLGSTRCKEMMEPEGRAEARRRLTEAGVSGLIVIGGNGSLTGAHRLLDPEEAPADFTTRIVGVPASIDNDVGLTGYAIGVDTAINTIVEACDKISDTASAHDRTFIVEVMGRDSGYLAMAAGIASAADAVLFGEAHKDEDAVVASVVDVIRRAQARTDRRTKRVLILKAEGLSLSTADLQRRVAEVLHGDPETAHLETRATILGHVVRGGRPSAFDRLLGSRLGHAAVRALLDGQSDLMVGWVHGPAALDHPGVRICPHDPHCLLAELPSVLEETRRLISGESPLTRWRARIFEEISEVLAL